MERSKGIRLWQVQQETLRCDGCSLANLLRTKDQGDLHQSLIHIRYHRTPASDSRRRRAVLNEISRH
ncbi:hypothetical protein KOW79_020900 [Hemibagrus wyckioides]|uniref:Uncharacterized protein n=1 Tax=Hemibagrus wyckioides TaxID=337641 RepID=A0A9D3N781_9TELE|nr:hypothetical protein KOW79_020900 [Hemibagrus wyckioides]